MLAAKFLRLTHRHDRANARFFDAVRSIQSAFENDLRKRFEAKHGKLKARKRKGVVVPPAVYELKEIDASLVESVFAEWRTVADRRSKREIAVREELNRRIVTTANAASLTPSDGVWSRFATCDSYVYNTQTNPAGYAYGDAKVKAAEATAAGFQSHIRCTKREPVTHRFGVPHATYEVWINADPVTAAMLSHRDSLPLPELVAAMWKAGVNPRVSMPFLPHGFEEKHGIDYFGNRYTPAVAG